MAQETDESSCFTSRTQKEFGCGMNAAEKQKVVKELLRSEFEKERASESGSIHCSSQRAGASMRAIHKIAPGLRLTGPDNQTATFSTLILRRAR
jgi:hypothetical protein